MSNEKPLGKWGRHLKAERELCQKVIDNYDDFRKDVIEGDKILGKELADALLIAAKGGHKLMTRQLLTAILDHMYVFERAEENDYFWSYQRCVQHWRELFSIDDIIERKFT